MESLSSSLINPKIHKIAPPNSTFIFTNRNLTPNPLHFSKKKPQSIKTLATHPSIPLSFPFPLSSIASESANESSSRINLEAIVVSIDDFFNRYPFFVAGVVFVWLFVVPVTQEYLRKYKFISAIDAFKKLKEEPEAELLDIRDKKTLRVLGSPNLKMLSKDVVQVEFRDGDDEGFVKKVKENFTNPSNTTICVLDK